LLPPTSPPGSGWEWARLTVRACQSLLLLRVSLIPTGRLILDKTGLTSNYEVNLTWAWNDDPTSTSPSLFSALQYQLGLKLEPAKAPVDVVVIDHLERPSEN
jgi:uncharacterized protein (TIGR03435 family)